MAPGRYPPRRSAFGDAAARRRLMTRQAPCGPAEAARKARLARAYLDLAEMTAGQEGDENRNVAAGNAVLAAIAASDALTCLHLGRHSRGVGHQEATTLLRAIKPDGA